MSFPQLLNFDTELMMPLATFMKAKKYCKSMMRPLVWWTRVGRGVQDGETTHTRDTGHDDGGVGQPVVLFLEHQTRVIMKPPVARGFLGPLHEKLLLFFSPTVVVCHK
jgi:hypothetical protein